MKRCQYRSTTFQLLTTLVVVLGSRPLIAQPAVDHLNKERNGKVLEEVVVTARKRDESLQEVPVAVSAVSADEMAANNIDNISDLASIVPGLERRESGGGIFFMRGVGQLSDVDLSIDPGVGVYVDGVFLPRSDTQLIDAVELQSVQVLRGPQGTLFGKNTVGGAILVTTKDPHEEFGGQFRSTLDSLGQKNVQLSLNVPLLNEKLLTKFTFATINSDGYAEDVDTGSEVGADNRDLFIFQALASLTDSLEMKALAYYLDRDESSSVPYSCEFVTEEGLLWATRSSGNPTIVKDACIAQVPLLEERKVQQDDFGLRFTSEDLLLALTVNWALPAGDFKSVSSYSYKGPNTNDYDYDGTEILTIQNFTHYSDYLEEEGIFDKKPSRWGLSQEFQFSGDLWEGKLSYTTGLFFAKDSIDNSLDGTLVTRNGWIGLEALEGLPPPPPGSIYVTAAGAEGISDLLSTSYALFGQAYYDITPALALTLGARYGIEQREYRLRRFVMDTVPTPATPINFGLGTAAPIALISDFEYDRLGNVPIQWGDTDRADIEYERFSPMASLAWTLTEQFDLGIFDNLMIYLTVAEGFKSGGFTTLVGRLDTFEPEVVISTEVGVKLDALKGRLRTNLSAYRADYTDIQLVVTRQSISDGAEIATTNAGEALIKGFEFETTFLLTDNLTLTASGAYTEVDIIEYQDFDVASPLDSTLVELDRSGEPYPYVPELAYNLSVRYFLPATPVGDFNFVLARSYTDAVYIGADALTGEERFRDLAYTDAVSTYTARATWIPFADHSLTVSLFGNNITDELYVSGGASTLGSFGTQSLILGKERHWGMDVTYEF